MHSPFDQPGDIPARCVVEGEFEHETSAGASAGATSDLDFRLPPAVVARFDPQPPPRRDPPVAWAYTVRTGFESGRHTAEIEALESVRGGGVRLMSKLAKALDAPLAWLAADG